VSETPVALEGAEIDRVDGVKGPATGIPFVLVKALDDDENRAQLEAFQKEQGEPAAAEQPAPEGSVTPEPAEAVSEDSAPAEVEKSETTDPALAALESLDAELTEHLVETGTIETEAPVEKAEAPAAEAPVEVEATAETVEAPAETTGEAVEKAELPAMTEQQRLARYLGLAEPVEKALPTAEEAANAALPEAPAYEAPVVDGTPGSPEWEAADADNANNAIALLLALKARIDIAAERERAEWDSPSGEYDDIDNAWDLEDASCSLDWILGCLAKFAVTEAAEGVAKSADSPNSVRADVFVARLIPALKETDVTDVAKSETATTEAVTPETTPEAAPAAPEETVEKAEGNQPAATEAPATEDLFKSALDQFAKSDVFKDTITGVVKAAIAEDVPAAIEGSDVVKGLAARLETVENQPVSGGPLLRGATGLSADGLTLVTKGGPVGPAGEIPAEPEDIRKALESVTDPGARDALSRALAKSSHPLAAR
jgi:hypothetical protein